MATTLSITTGFDTQGREGSPDHAVPDRKYPRATAGAVYGSERFIALWMPLGGVVNRTVLSATLSAPVFGSWLDQDIAVRPFAAAWSAETLTYNNAPAVTGSPVWSGATGALVDGDRVEWDVLPLVQAIANGDPNYGWRVHTTDDVRFYGFDSGSGWTLTVELSDVLPEPTGLTPVGVVSVPAWVAQVDLVDDVAAVQVQVDPAADEVSPAFDSGEVPSTVPELDLAATAYAGLADGAATSWRLRLKTGDNLWSEWSDWVEVERAVKPTLTLTSPSETETVVETNLATNPSGELDNAGWAASGGSDAPATSTEQAWVDAQSIKCARGAGTSGTYGFYSLHPDLTEGAGDYSVAVRVWIPSLIPTNSGDTGLRVGGSGLAPFNLDTDTRDDWQVFTATFTWDGSGSVYLQAYDTTLTAGAYMYIDGLHVVPGTTPPTVYFDGDTPDTEGHTCRWTGAAHASASEKVEISYPLLDPSPSIEANIDSGTIEQWRVRVAEVGNRAEILYDSGAIPVDPPAASVAWQVPLRNRDGERIFPTDGDYDLNVRVRDRHDRVSSPGDPSFIGTWQTVSMDVDGAEVPPDTLTVTAPVDGTPGATLTWTRPGDPDAFVVLRDDEVIARLDEQDVQVGTGAWEWTDTEAPPNRAATWKVRAVTNRKQSPASPTATFTNPVEGVWIISRFGSVVMRGDRVDGMAQTEKRQTIPMPFRPDDVDVVTATGGYVGTYQGVLHSADGDVEDALTVLRKLRWHTDEEVTLTWGTVAIVGRLRGLTFGPAPELLPKSVVGWGNDQHGVSFGFQQTRDFRRY